MTKTMAVVMAVSRRVGHVTFSTSERTSRRNLPGLTFAISFCRLKPLAAPRGRANKPAAPTPRVRPVSGPILGNLSRRKSKRAASERAVSYRQRRLPSSKWVIRSRLQDLALGRRAPPSRPLRAGPSRTPPQAKAGGRNGGAATPLKNQGVRQESGAEKLRAAPGHPASLSHRRGMRAPAALIAIRRCRTRDWRLRSEAWEALSTGADWLSGQDDFNHVLLDGCRYQLHDQLASRHAAELCFKREARDHVLSERYFAGSILAFVMHRDRKTHRR